MKYLVVISLTALFGFVSAAPASAQQVPTDAAVDNAVDRVMYERAARTLNGVFGVRADDDDDVTRRRGETARDADRRRGRSETGGRANRADRTDRTDRADRAERTGRRDRDPRAGKAARRGERSLPGDVDRRGGDDDYGSPSSARRGDGPPFCRSGEGHPVHGTQWCIDKGFGLGGAHDVFDDHRNDRRDSPRRSDRTILDDVLGRRPNR